MRFFGLNDMNYYFDTYGIIELIKDNPSYQKFKEATIITAALNISETHYYLIEFASESEADKIINGLNLSLIEPNKEIAVEASKFRFKNKKLKLSYADCLGYIISQKNNLVFLTGDDGFKDLENVEFVK